MDSSRRRQPADGRTSDRGGYGYGYGGHSSYGYGYGGYGYGYGYGGSGGSDGTLQKTIQDYLLILRERLWYIVVTFLLILGATAVYTFTRVPLFQSAASVEVLRHTPTVMQQPAQVAAEAQISSVEDLNTQVNILQSQAIIDRVASRLTGADRAAFMAPYRRSGRPITEILLKYRDIVPERLSYIIEIRYRHPNKAMAATVANLFADEYIAYNERLRAQQSMQAVDELRERADEQRRKVDTIAAEIQAYREKNNLVSLDQRKDIVTEALKDLNKQVTDSSAALEEAETNWKQVQASQAAGRSGLELPCVAENLTVQKLQQDVADQRIVVAELSQRYRPKHPKMREAMSSLQAAEQQLAQAIQMCTAQVQTQYSTALSNYRKAQSALAAQETDSLELDRYGLEYSNLERDYLENEKILEEILASQILRQEASTGTLENEIARIVDRAVPARKPFSPSYILNLSLGTLGGLGVGLGVAFFAAYTDDRVKSAFDIESVIGLNLLGILPKVKKMGDLEQIASAGPREQSSEVQEAFSSILSALQLREESKKAQCILVTSTIAGEGKTFISTGLAETYASHGERVVIVDCDLRRPAVNRVFHLENLKGVIDVCASSCSLDEATVRGVRPNLDVIPTGGRSKNPTQLLNGKEFAQMISDLRKRYDRVFIDTPPIGIVSDAFLILPQVDGSLYSIFFNKARRDAAKFSAQRLLESNVPNFGAVLNGLDGGLGGYYYAHYYGGAYKDYYVGVNGHSNGAGPKLSEPIAPQKRLSRRR